MKISPSNQTLILASERRGPANSPDGSSGKTAASTGSVLQRVTIVASQPDATVVYLRADYSSTAAGVTEGPATYSDRASTTYSKQSVWDADDTGSQSTVAGLSQSTSIVVQQQTAATRRDGFGNALIGGRDTGPSSHLSPVEQYARTQRILAAAPQVQQIDVHA